MEFDNIGWDEYYSGLLNNVAVKSKDPSRKVGAIATRDGSVVMTGFNGFPRGVDDRQESRYSKKFKNLHTVHAEANVVALAAGAGVSLKGTTIYCNLHPCLPCANLLIQAGVSRVVCPPAILEPAGEEIYHFGLAIEVLAEAGIVVEGT